MRLHLRSILALMLLLSFVETAMDGHVHSQNGVRHGGLASLVQPAEDADSRRPALEERHACTGKTPHLHPRLADESADCFLCVGLRRAPGQLTLASRLAPVPSQPSSFEPGPVRSRVPRPVRCSPDIPRAPPLA